MAFFTAKGRLRRRSYLFRLMGLYLTGILIYALPGWLYAETIPATVQLAAIGGLAAVWYLVVVQCLLRLHDLDLRAWWALVGLLPVVSYALGTGLQLVQGSIGPNRFGLDPKRPLLLPPASEMLPPAASSDESRI